MITYIKKIITKPQKDKFLNFEVSGVRCHWPHTYLWLKEEYLLLIYAPDFYLAPNCLRVDK